MMHRNLGSGSVSMLIILTPPTQHLCLEEATITKNFFLHLENFIEFIIN